MSGLPVRLDLKTRISAVVLVLFVAGIWLFAYLAASRLQTEFATVLADQQFSAVSHTAAEIEQKIALRFDALSIVAREISPDMMAKPEQLAALLAQRPVLTSMFGNTVVVVAADGTGLASYPPIQGGQPGYAEMEYFREPMTTGLPTLGKPRLGRVTQRLGVAFAMPIPGRDARPLGVLVGFATLNDRTLFGQIAEAKVGKTGWIAINDARHRLIVAINDPKRVMQPFPAPGVNTMLDRYVAGYEGSGISINSQGREVLSSAKMIGKTGWFVQVVLPTNEAFEPIQGLKAHAYLLAGGLSLLAAVICWWVIRRLLAPLAAASREMRQFAEGSQDLHELPITRQDEIGDLIGSFNLLSNQRRNLQTELEHLARTDALTGLPNRRYFMEAAGQELLRGSRFGTRLSLLMLDVDHFKHVNDTYGHATGDRVLKKLAETCRATLREVDFIARLGGEEFAVILPQTDHAAALEAAERVRLAVEEARVPLEQGLPVCITTSIGVATQVDDSMNIDTLLSQADRALYEAKHLGRNRVCGSA